MTSRADVVSTLHLLLDKLNLPIGLKEGDLVKQLIERNAEVSRLEILLQQERLMSGEATSALSKANAALKCQICVTKDVTHVMAPCGHMICIVCLQQLHRNKCPFCRKDIQSKVKMFTQQVDLAT